MRTKQKVDLSLLHKELEKFAVEDVPQPPEVMGRGKCGKTGKRAKYSVLKRANGEIEIKGIPDMEIQKVLERLTLNKENKKNG